MKNFPAILGLAFGLMMFASCAKQSAVGNGPQATIYLRDGTQFAGMVTSSSPTSVTIAGDANTSRTFDMKDVKSIEYADVPAPAPAAAVPGTPAPAASAPASARLQQREPPHVEHYHPEESSIRTKTYLLRTGTELSVRTEETIDAKKAVNGQGFAAEVSKDVLDAEGAVVIPRGSNAKIVIRSASKGGKILGQSDLVLDLESVSVDGRQYLLDTADLEQKGRSGVGKNKRTAEFVGAGAAVGTVIGAIFGQGKGAAIGAASGAAAGAATQVVTRGQIKVPAETVLTFQLDKPLHVSAAQ